LYFPWPAAFSFVHGGLKIRLSRRSRPAVDSLWRRGLRFDFHFPHDFTFLYRPGASGYQFCDHFSLSKNLENMIKVPVSEAIRHKRAFTSSTYPFLIILIFYIILSGWTKNRTYLLLFVYVTMST
jgi:hypothetical protein